MSKEFDCFIVDLNELIDRYKVKLVLNIDESVSVIKDRDDNKWQQTIVFTDELND